MRLNAPWQRSLEIGGVATEPAPFGIGDLAASVEGGDPSSLHSSYWALAQRWIWRRSGTPAYHGSG
ncbi:hypothetical protein ACF07B_07060 [Streptomyces sp. NPDC015532]|uniref:hypothetical protein n=1 Tax=Streptomyces sp. NPDC015532 TaxID=3364960 RepID=UPI0036F9682F